MDDAGTWKIVLIDDEKDIRKVVSIVLEAEGYSVAAAENGEAGIVLCEQTSPQIVITDIRMPGITGLEVLRRVKEKYPEIEVIVVTAFGEMETAVKALQLDASDFVTKPVDTDSLLIAIKRARQRYTARKTLEDYTRFLELENAQTTQELIKIYSFQKNLIKHSMDGILACDENGLVVTFNRAMEQILEFKSDDVVNKMSISRFFENHKEAAFKKNLNKQDFGGKNRLLLYETTMLGKDGSAIPVQISASILMQNNNTGSGLVCFVRDLREMRRLEREISDQASILHQDKMMSLGRLSASVVHEINNPLFGVLNYIRLMIKITERGALKADSLKKFQAYLDIVEKETQRCSSIISSLLTFSRKSEPCFGKVSVQKLFEKSILLSRHKLELCGIKLVSKIDDSIPPVNGDANQLLQCIINLIFNAVDAMVDNGTLTLSVEYQALKKTVVITVHDTGKGIDQKHLQKIFDPFFTTKKEGLGVGLGLSTVYGIAEHHKGFVDVKSRPGDTAFMLHLPL